MQSKKMKPQFEQKRVEIRAPRMQRNAATCQRGLLANLGVSVMMVEVASTIEKAESTPRVNSVRARSIAHPLENGRVSIAVG